MKATTLVLSSLALLILTAGSLFAEIPVTDPHIAFSPYNWYRSAAFAQSPNPGAYLKVGFSGTKIALNLDVSPLTGAKVPENQYPVVRYSIDGRPAETVQLTPRTNSLQCAIGLQSGVHTLLFQYVAGYVFLDFWSPVNVLRVTGFTLDDGASLVSPSGVIAKHTLNALFLGDSITNGDDDIATFKSGITNGVETQDATVGYPSVVASGIGAEYGVVAYGGASWDHTAADGHTPGLMTSFSMLDNLHSRLIDGKLFPLPDEVFINMGENSSPAGGDVTKLLASLRAASGANANIFLIVPFSGRSRSPIESGFASYQAAARSDAHTYLLDLGNTPYLTDSGPTMLSVDGQHPLATLHGLLGAQLVEARAQKLRRR